MFGNLAIPVLVATGAAASLTLVFMVPPLTTGNASVSNSEKYAADVRQERSYCESSLSGVNCACFAGVASQVLAHETNKVRGAQYAKPHDLARDQAQGSC